MDEVFRFSSTYNSDSYLAYLIEFKIHIFSHLKSSNIEVYLIIDISKHCVIISRFYFSFREVRKIMVHVAINVMLDLMKYV